MSDRIEALFVGGPWDGERHSVERFATIVVPEFTPGDLIRHHSYRLRQYAHSDGSREWRYVSVDDDAPATEVQG